MKRIRSYLTLIGILCLTLLTACEDHLYYILYQDLPQKEWDSNEPLYFNIPPTEQEMDVAVTLGVRTTALFRYKDIVARAELLDNDSVISSLPLTITLYQGEGLTQEGMLMHENYSKPQALHMQANHNYVLRVTHLMRLNPLDEVQSVGIIVEK